ncbi:MAG: hypothetical protein J5589_02535 [Firmicutes bacterium]|nr:hypothetical protein [Bacillota bacterium]
MNIDDPPSLVSGSSFWQDRDKIASRKEGQNKGLHQKIIKEAEKVEK